MGREKIRQVCVPAAWLAAVGALATGCAHSHRCAPPTVENPPTAHLIFNSDALAAEPIVDRPGDWPSTYVASRWPEETLYRETIRDWQGTFWADRDRYDRRFYAVRTGATRR